MLAAEHAMMKFTGEHRNTHHPITITKFIDKSGRNNVAFGSKVRRSGLKGAA